MIFIVHFMCLMELPNLVDRFLLTPFHMETMVWFTIEQLYQWRFVALYILSTFSAWSTEVKKLSDIQQGMLARVLAVTHIQILKVASYK